nr:RNA polymerase alpha subunit [Tetraena hamiensis var. qatarensis]
MVKDKIAVSTKTLQWKCVESRIDSKRLYYGRFVVLPLVQGQANTIGILMRRVLLGEIEGTCITCAKFKNIQHEYSTIVGVQESVHEILMNLKEVVLRSNLYGIQDAYLYAQGPGYVTAKDIIVPRSTIEIIDNTQYIAKLTEGISLFVELKIERNRGYHIKTSSNNFEDRSYPIEAVFMPVRNAHYSIHSYRNGNETQEILILEIWTNGSLTPKEALQQASRILIDLFIPFIQAEEENLDLKNLKNNQQKNTLPFLSFYNDHIRNKSKKETALKYFFIDQLELKPRIYNCLKKSNIHTFWDLLTIPPEDLMKIEHLDIEDLINIFEILSKHWYFSS